MVVAFTLGWLGRLFPTSSPTRILADQTWRLKAASILSVNHSTMDPVKGRRQDQFSIPLHRLELDFELTTATFLPTWWWSWIDDFMDGVTWMLMKSIAESEKMVGKRFLEEVVPG